jgi:hypothetical protein
MHLTVMKSKMFETPVKAYHVDLCIHFADFIEMSATTYLWAGNRS